MHGSEHKGLFQVVTKVNMTHADAQNTVALVQKAAP